MDRDGYEHGVYRCVACGIVLGIEPGQGSTGVKVHGWDPEYPDDDGWVCIDCEDSVVYGREWSVCDVCGVLYRRGTGSMDWVQERELYCGPECHGVQVEADDEYRERMLQWRIELRGRVS